MELKFVTKPDAAGFGYIIVEGIYYGLPVDAVRVLEGGLQGVVAHMKYIVERAEAEGNQEVIQWFETVYGKGIGN